MPLPASHDDLLKALRTTARKLDQEFDTFDRPSHARWLDDDGVSPCDRLGYQIGWGRLLLGWDADERAGSEPVMPAEGYGWKDLGKLAKSFYDQYKG